MKMLLLALRSLRCEWHLPELRTLAASLVLAVSTTPSASCITSHAPDPSIAASRKALLVSFSRWRVSVSVRSTMSPSDASVAACTSSGVVACATAVLARAPETAPWAAAASSMATIAADQRSTKSAMAESARSACGVSVARTSTHTST